MFRSEEHTSELQSHLNLVCRLLLEKKKLSLSLSLSLSRSLSLSLYLSLSLALCFDHSIDLCHSPKHIPRERDTYTHIFFFNDTATPEIYPLPLHDALPI